MDSGSAALEFLSRWAQQQASRKGAGGVMLPGNGLVSRDESRRLASKRHAHVHDIYVNNAMRPGDKIALGFEKDFYSF